MDYTRRDVGKFALSAIPAAALLGKSAPVETAALQALPKPNSLINGVQIGVIVPYSFGQEGGDAANLLWNVVKIGISAIELQAPPAEAFVGATAPAAAGGRGGGAGGPAGGGRGAGQAPGATPAGQAAPAAGARGGRAGAPGGAAPGGGRGRGGRGDQPPPTPEEQAAQAAAQAAAWKRRLEVPMDRYKALRKLYNDAGVSIYGFKMSLNMSMTDEHYDYVFNAAEALGANHVTMELPTDPVLLKRIGEFALKRKIYAAYHTHGQGNFNAFDQAFELSKGNMSNVDVGHYYGATGESAQRFLDKWHSRTMSYHMKDKTGPKHATPDQNRPWGQAETPLRDILQAHRKGRWKSIATIELEYPVPEGSTRANEIAKCLQYCRQALA
jgi:sugar phosphate isomerase/epimerase